MLFYGMSSESAMTRHVGGVAKYRAAEGKTVKLPLRGPVENTARDILGGLRSACTYVGASRLKELTKRTTFIRVQEQRTGYSIACNRLHWRLRGASVSHPPAPPMASPGEKRANTLPPPESRPASRLSPASLVQDAQPDYRLADRFAGDGDAPVFQHLIQRSRAFPVRMSCRHSGVKPPQRLNACQIGSPERSARGPAPDAGATASRDSSTLCSPCRKLIPALWVNAGMVKIRLSCCPPIRGANEGAR
ncbi:GMP reductase [Klebsiella pneumoniae]|nr:GMP reductase [Klebsiella pneumoniae]